MRRIPSGKPSANRRRMWIIALGLILVGAWLYFQPQPSPKKQAALPAAAPAYDPVLATVEKVFGPITFTENPFWSQESCWEVNGEIDGGIVQLLVDGKGHLWHVMLTLRKENREQTVAPLTTAAEAREVAVHRLRDLNMLPAGNRLTLLRHPRLDFPDEIDARWTMVCKVQSVVAPPDEITIALDRDTGLPVYIRRTRAEFRTTPEA